MSEQLLHAFNGEVRGIGDDVDENRTITFVISDESKDRHGTVLKTDNWDLEHFNRNPIIGYQHDVYGRDMCNKPDPDDVIGSGRAYVDMVDGERKLCCDVTFETAELNEKADKIFRKVKAGSIRATSVGFRPAGGGIMKNDEDGKEERLEDYPSHIPKGFTFYPDRMELVELSIVNIPSNRNALKRNLRDYASNALRFLKRELGQEFTYEEIGAMRVFDVMEMLESGEKPERASADIIADIPTEEITKAAADLVAKYAEIDKKVEDPFTEPTVSDERAAEKKEIAEESAVLAIREGTQKQKIKILNIQGRT
jgi:hypothetical protein